MSHLWRQRKGCQSHANVVWDNGGVVSDGGALRIRLCGEFGIDASDVDLPPGVLPGRQGRLVLAYLVCAQGRAVARDELAELLWPERLPDSWTTSLSAVVSKLRRLLAATGLDAGRILVSSTAGIALELPDDVWVDWEVAQQAMAAAEAAVADGEPAVCRRGGHRSSRAGRPWVPRRRLPVGGRPAGRGPRPLRPIGDRPRRGPPARGLVRVERSTPVATPWPGRRVEKRATGC